MQSPFCLGQNRTLQTIINWSECRSLQCLQPESKPTLAKDTGSLPALGKEYRSVDAPQYKQTYRSSPPFGSEDNRSSCGAHLAGFAHQLPLAPKTQHETIGAGVPTCWTSNQSLQDFRADMLANRVLCHTSFRTASTQEGGERQELLLRALRVVRTSCCVCYLCPAHHHIARHTAPDRQPLLATRRGSSPGARPDSSVGWGWHTFASVFCTGLLLRMMCVTQMMGWNF